MLFTLGPVEMFPRTMSLGAHQVPYFRVPEFSELMLENERLVQHLARAPEGSRTVFLTASGTGAMEAAVMNCLTPSDRVLVIVGGAFGRRFEEICLVHGIPYDALELEFGEELTSSMLARFSGRDYTALLVNIHETSIAHLYDARMLSDFCRENGAWFIVDAISSFLADSIDMSALGIDVLIGSSQKALALPPGVSFAVLSERILEQRVLRSTRSSVYFGFQEYLRDGSRGQTPFTPAVQVLIQLNDRLRMLSEIGVDAEVLRLHDVAEDFRHRIGDLKLDIPSYGLSNAATPIVFRKPVAHRVFDELRRRHDAVLTPNGGELGEVLLRVGHLGNHEKSDNAVLIEALGMVLESIDREG